MDGGRTKLYTPAAGVSVIGVAASRDGGWLTWIERADESDIWLMTLEEPAPGAAR